MKLHVFLWERHLAAMIVAADLRRRLLWPWEATPTRATLHCRQGGAARHNPLFTKLSNLGAIENRRHGLCHEVINYRGSGKSFRR
jgi:hypothetical protein